ncbi:MAG: hypothetical protein WD407_14445 [Rhodospirillales bacterium]
MSRIFTLVLAGLLLVGCVTDAEMEAYYRERCQYDRITFKKIEPGSAELEYCLELYRSGLGGHENDPLGGAGLGQFAD